MPRRLRAVLLALHAMWAAAGCYRGADSPTLGAAPRGPNVILVTIDTLRADRVGAYGAPFGATPTLDAIASEGTVFESAIAPAPLTLPSHASLLTGTWPPRHGARHNGLFKLGGGVESLAERFRAAGYETGAVVGSIVLAPAYGLDRGFESYDADMGSRRAAGAGYEERPAEEVTDAALAWIAARRRPFLLWVHYYDPHAAYAPPSPFAERFAGDPYAGEIAYVDAELRRLLEPSRASGTLGRTLLVVTSDHGESLGEHEEATHAYGLYDATLRVPLLLRGPGILAGRRVKPVVSLVDVAPTLLALVGLPPLESADGRDLVPLLRGEGRAIPAYSETLATRLDHGWAPLYAARSDRHLYVRAPRPELYDVVSDPAQLTNLLEGAAADGPAGGPAPFAEVVRELDGRISAVLAAELPSSAASPDDETRARLRALGYLAPEASPARSETDPKDALRWLPALDLARSRYQEGSVEEAERIASGLLGRLPSSVWLHDILARIYLVQNRPAAALTHAGEALRLAPESSDQHVLLGQAKLARGDVDGAILSFERALDLDPDDPEAHAGLMWRLRRGGSLEDAKSAAARAAALRPRSAEVRTSVADTWDQLGHYDLALESYREAVALDPGYGHAHVGLAVQSARLGDPSEVERHLAAAGQAARSVGARMRVAIALAGRGEAARAEALLLGVLEELPDLSPAMRVLARLYEETGRAEEARALRARAGVR